MDFLRGVKSRVFAADKQVETEPTLLYGVLLTPTAVGTAGILRCYDGQDTTAELIAEFQASYDFGTSLQFPVQFSHALYIDLVSGLATVTIMWLTNVAALGMFHNELKLRKSSIEDEPLLTEKMLEILGL